jgi:four helix bundle protein
VRRGKLGVMDEVSFEDWAKTIPDRLRIDPLWESIYYRKSMYLFDLVWNDCDILRKDYRGREIVGQLVRSSGSIFANAEEAFGRGVGTADYIRILRIALGEARETQGWYIRCRQILPWNIFESRSELITQIIAMLVTTISGHRKRLKERIS